MIKYRTEYVSLQTKATAHWDGSDAGGDLGDQETTVMEYVEVRLTQMAIGVGLGGAQPAAHKGYHSHSKGHSYMTIFCPAVNEALRCVVDYFPSVDLSGTTVKVIEPFAVFVFFERELSEYRERLLVGSPDDSCANKNAYKHIGIVQDFVRSRTRQPDIDAERERHARGFATFDMLWLLFKPGSDVYYSRLGFSEHEPYVLKEVQFKLANGCTNEYDLTFWNVDANRRLVGPSESWCSIPRFAGEMEIVKLVAYPCEYCDSPTVSPRMMRKRSRSILWKEARNGISS